jgi:hypothetical protein
MYGKDNPYAKTDSAAVAAALKALGSKDTAAGLLKSIGDALSKNKIYTDVLNVYAKDTKGLGNQKLNVKSQSTPGPTINSPSTTKLSIPLVSLLSNGVSPTKGTKFQAEDGKWYIVQGMENMYDVSVKKAARGGKAKSGKPVIVGDGGRPELFIPKTDGIIIPDLSRIQNLAPSYNIPNKGFALSNAAQSSNSVSNNMYNVKIELNGTNLSADDVYNKFEQKLAMLNAKQGRNKTIGGI